MATDLLLVRGIRLKLPQNAVCAHQVRQQAQNTPGDLNWSEPEGGWVGGVTQSWLEDRTLDFLQLVCTVCCCWLGRYAGLSNRIPSLLSDVDMGAAALKIPFLQMHLHWIEYSLPKYYVSHHKTQARCSSPPQGSDHWASQPACTALHISMNEWGAERARKQIVESRAGQAKPCNAMPPPPPITITHRGLPLSNPLSYRRLRFSPHRTGCAL